MSWLMRYRLRHYLSESIYIFPLLGMFAAIVLARALHQVELALGWTSTIQSGAAQAILTTLAASMFTLVIFVSSALLVFVQLASAQLSPRIIGVVFKDPVTKGALTVFVFTFTLTLAVLVNVSNVVYPLTARVAAYSSLISLGVFLYLIDHIGKAIRPSGALWAVARLGRKVIEDVYPQPISRSPSRPQVIECRSADENIIEILSPADGVILAFDVVGLVAMANTCNVVIELMPQVGDFVARGDVLFQVHGKLTAEQSACVQQLVAVGQERTLEQDATFPFRILVDIAAKGLSPAINDPTTAVLALDQIHHLLRNVGSRQLDEGQVRDQHGKLRLIYRTPDWEDFVTLAVTEIRHFGAASIQVARRLRAMLENLIQTLPEERTTQLHEELELLKRTAERVFMEPTDRIRAEVSDYQGVGGKHAGLKELAQRKQ